MRQLSTPRRNLLSILLWSVIAAAFVGPGTVTTAALAGAEHSYALLWAVLFSAVACLVLQEAAARLTVASGDDLGAALRRRYPSGAARLAVLVVVLGAVVLGCAAYEAGNVLGAVAGASLVVELPGPALTMALGALATLLLWLGAPSTVARGLAVLVALMGLTFVAVAVRLGPPLGEVAVGSLMPRIPEGSGILAVGLLGTTVVPYNLFLGSRLAAGENLRDMRLGLSVAVLLGGAVTFALVLAGAALDGDFSYARLAALLGERVGAWGGPAFALGLFAAGLSSAITAPLAAGLTARSLLGDESPAWGDRGNRYRSVWGGVLAVGVALGVSGVRPVPAIVLAQALNGVLLPLVAVFLLLSVNDRERLGEAINGALANAVLGGVVALTVLLGLGQLLRAGAAAFGLAPPSPGQLTLVAAICTLALGWPVLRAVRENRISPRSLDPVEEPAP